MYDNIEWEVNRSRRLRMNQICDSDWEKLCVQMLQNKIKIYSISDICFLWCIWWGYHITSYGKDMKLHIFSLLNVCGQLFHPSLQGIFITNITAASIAAAISSSCQKIH